MGGVETHVREISERLAERFEVEVLTTDPSGELVAEEIIGGVKVKRFKSWAPNESYYFSVELKKSLAKNVRSSDILHAHSYPDLPALYCTRVRKVKKFVFTPHYHGKGGTFFRNLLHIPYRLVAKKIFDKADRIICVSNYEKKRVLDDFRVREEKIAVIPNGLDLKEFEGLEKRGKKHRLILYVGRLEKYKGIDCLIKALPKLDDDIFLEIVGKGLHKKNLIKLMNKLDVTSRIRFYQDLPRKDLLKKYADADLVVLLSKFEAYSMTIAEALAAGTPCVVANTSALTEWVDDENCFGISYPISVEELSKLVNHVIESYNEAYLKKATREKIRDWNEVVERLEGVYNFS